VFSCESLFAAAVDVIVLDFASAFFYKKNIRYIYGS
jgi:hypothetical protein